MSASESQTRLLVLLFTDLLDSSRLKVELGDADYVEQIARPHNDSFRELLARFPGAEENNYTGDGFLATFGSVKDAVNFALLFHHTLQTKAWRGVVPSTRIGIHIGDTVEFEASSDDDKLLASHAADMCARVMGLGDGGQTLLTRAAFDSARQYVRKHPDTDEDQPPEIQWLAHGRYLFKGKDEPMEVFEVGAVGAAPLQAPASSEKARRALSPEEEQTLGWRPAIKLTIPGKPGWILQEQLGEGGFGEVWLAQQQRLKEQRAFKFCFDADRLRSFKRELTLFRLIQQGLGDRDDIVRLLDVRIDQPPFFLESEYVHLGNLRHWSESQGGIGCVPLETRLKLLADVARAVAAAHSLGIIHKDIKPSNILIDERADGSPQPKLADFGIGVLTDRALLAQHDVTETGFTESLALGNDSSRTGTRLYAPPETQVGKPASTAGDVYSLGVMLYQFVAGDLTRPLGVGWESDIDDELLREDITACTHRDPTKRLSNATELADRLEALESRRAERAAAVRAETEREEAERRAVEQTRRTRLLKAGLAVAMIFVVVAGAAAFWINSERQDALKQRRLAVAEKKIADVQREKAIRQETIAKRNEKIAEEQRKQAVAAKDSEADERKKAVIAQEIAEARRKELKAVLEFFQENVLVAARPAGQDGGLGVDAKIRDAIDAAEPQIAELFRDQPLVEAEIRHTMGATYLYLGEAELAIRQYERVWNLRKSNLGPEHPATLGTMNNLAKAYRDAGRRDAALPLLEETLKLTKAKLGPEHVNTLGTMNNLALAYRDAGRRDEALPLLVETLKLRKAKLGPEHPDTLISMNNLAGAYRAAGRLDEALPLFEETLKLRKAKLGPEHPDTLMSMGNLAVAYRDAGRLAEALPLFETTLKLRKAKLGPEHPDTLMSMGNLASAYQDAGRLNAALPLFEETLKLMKTKLGPEHPATLGSMNNLAMAYKDAGRLDAALPLLEETLKLTKAKLGPEHTDTLRSMNNLAMAFQDAGRLEKALPLLEETLKLTKAKLGPEHPATLNSMGNLALLYLKLRQPEKSLSLFGEFIAIHRKQAKRDDLRFSGLLAAVSAKLLKHQQFAAAESYMRECLTIREKLLPDHWLLFSAKSLLGAALAGQQKFEEAEPLLLDGYNGMQQRENDIPELGKYNLTNALTRLVDLYTAWKKPAEAAKWQAKLDERQRRDEKK